MLIICSIGSGHHMYTIVIICTRFTDTWHGLMDHTQIPQSQTWQANDDATEALMHYMLLYHYYLYITRKSGVVLHTLSSDQPVHSLLNEVMNYDEYTVPSIRNIHKEHQWIWLGYYHLMWMVGITDIFLMVMGISVLIITGVWKAWICEWRCNILTRHHRTK